MTATAQIRDPLVGSRIDGRYLIQGVLGRGGMGVVYDGIHEQLGRAVAIKVLSSGIATEPSAIERFLREARTASSLTHGNIVDVTDLGELPDGRPYLVMPKMQGQDLLSLLHEKGPQSPTRVVELLRGAAAALDLIHAKGFVHRDVKPENLMHVIREDGSEAVLLLDFGIVALTSGTDQRLTAQGIVFGTPVYLAPETMDSVEPDARTDVYSLAVVAYEMMTGRAPFEAGTAVRIMQLKTTVDAPTMQATCGIAFAKAIEDVVAGGLVRDPKMRYASAGEFVRALEAATRLPSTTLESNSVQEQLDAGAAARSSKLGALPTLSAPTTARGATDLNQALSQRVSRRKGLLIAASLGPLLGAVVAWGLPFSGLGMTPSAGSSIETPVPSHAASTLEPEPTILKREVPIEGIEADGQPEAQRLALPSEPTPERPTRNVDARAPVAREARRPSKAADVSAVTPAAPEKTSPVATAAAGRDSAQLLKAASQALMAGQLDQADKLYAEATHKDSRSAAAFRGLGLTSERLGRREAAITAFKRALELTPAGAQADSIRARLQKLSAN